MYDKQKISEAFCDYCERRSEKDLNILLQECGKMIKKVMMYYPAFRSCSDDLIQEVWIKMWQMLISPNVNLKNYVNDPVDFLHSFVKRYLPSEMKRYRRTLLGGARIPEKEFEIYHRHKIMKESLEKIAKEMGLEQTEIELRYCCVQGLFECSHISDGDNISEPSGGDDPAAIYEAKQEAINRLKGGRNPRKQRIFDEIADF